MKFDSTNSFTLSELFIETLISNVDDSNLTSKG